MSSCSDTVCLLLATRFTSRWWWSGWFAKRKSSGKRLQSKEGKFIKEDFYLEKTIFLYWEKSRQRFPSKLQTNDSVVLIRLVWKLQILSSITSRWAKESKWNRKLAPYIVQTLFRATVHCSNKFMCSINPSWTLIPITFKNEGVEKGIYKFRFRWYFFVWFIGNDKPLA